MTSKTQYKGQIEQCETELKRLKYQYKICSSSLELEKRKTKQLETLLNEKTDLIKALSAKKWYQFWR